MECESIPLRGEQSEALAGRRGGLLVRCVRARGEGVISGGRSGAAVPAACSVTACGEVLRMRGSSALGSPSGQEGFYLPVPRQTRRSATQSVPAGTVPISA